jgi:hypothetical protein
LAATRTNGFHHADLAHLPREHGGDSRGNQDRAEHESHRARRQHQEQNAHHLRLVGVPTGRRDAGF